LGVAYLQTKLVDFVSGLESSVVCIHQMNRENCHCGTLVDAQGLHAMVCKKAPGPWQGGRSLVWDVTVVSPLAASYVDRAATDAGTVADTAASRKTEKYSSLSSTYMFEPIAVECRVRQDCCVQSGNTTAPGRHQTILATVRLWYRRLLTT